jgi:hypothetical protein
MCVRVCVCRRACARFLMGRGSVKGRKDAHLHAFTYIDNRYTFIRIPIYVYTYTVYTYTDIQRWCDGA